MKTYIVLLRGINVGGHKKVPMAELRTLLAKSGFEDVKTYIQSGNVILKSSEEKSASIEHIVQSAIMNHFGFDVPIMSRTRTELQRVFNRCPFPNEKKEHSYFVLLSEIPDSGLVDEALKIKYDNEEFQIIDDCLYFYSSVGYGKSKFN